MPEDSCPLDPAVQAHNRWLARELIEYLTSIGAQPHLFCVLPQFDYELRPDESY
jgi:hypothetical protein